MRFFVKGGVWKNSEDEILKAGIMKYGKNNWARVASLLPRKSSKQCKARWFEWLDPSIKKTEWSREEDEKLLHMVKIMPTQWRSIAPVVGRTAAQCLQRYDQLLEQAARADAADPEEAEAIAHAARDAKRLRPGEIDPAPEIKPARPDAIDMDEDELEMLSEARARLANTKGKKAKRKAREKQLAEARRLAKLQKRRELKEAGLIRGGEHQGGGGSRARNKKRARDIDYNQEIPFHTKTPAGFYDTSREDSIASNPDFVKRTRRELTGKIRAEEEARKKKEDKRKHRKLLSTNLPAMIDKLAAINDPRNTVRRSTLNLPAPNVNDEEMRTVARMTEEARKRRMDAEASGVEATRGLLADPRGGTPFTSGGGGMSATPYGGGGGGGGSSSSMSMTPMFQGQQPGRTEMKKNTILEQARNLARMTAQQTPLMGGESTTLDGGTGWAGGAQPTPAPAMSSTMSSAMSSTMSSSIGGVTPMLSGGKRTRENSVVGSSKKKRRMRERAARDALRARLAGLPEPQYTYEVETPEGATDQQQENDSSPMLSPDAADVDRYARLRREEEEKKLFERQTSSVKMNLPRPTPAMVQQMWSQENGAKLNQGGNKITSIDRQIRETSLAMMWDDAIEKPYVAPGMSTTGVRPSNVRPTGMPTVENATNTDRFTRAADVLIRDQRGDATSWPEANAQVVQSHSLLSKKETKEWKGNSKNMMEEESRYRTLLSQNGRKVDKLRRKVDVLTKGHRLRSEETWHGMSTDHIECENMAVELATLHHSVSKNEEESKATLKMLDEEIANMRNKERELQSMYEQRSE